jgi:hypothetical protein
VPGRGAVRGLPPGHAQLARLCPKEGSSIIIVVIIIIIIIILLLIIILIGQRVVHGIKILPPISTKEAWCRPHDTPRQRVSQRPGRRPHTQRPQAPSGLSTCLEERELLELVRVGDVARGDGRHHRDQWQVKARPRH